MDNRRMLKISMCVGRMKLIHQTPSRSIGLRTQKGVKFVHKKTSNIYAYAANVIR